jgi:hypothetical protein
MVKVAIFCLLFMVAVTPCFAAEGQLPQTAEVGVSANVVKYAAITVTDGTIDFDFKDKISEWKEDNPPSLEVKSLPEAARIEVETNTDVDITFAGENLTLEGANPINVLYWCNKDGTTLDTFQQDNPYTYTQKFLDGPQGYVIAGKATLAGKISEQAAGTYGGKVTITVKAAAEEAEE